MTTADENGNWTTGPVNVAQGMHNYTATATDVAGYTTELDGTNVLFDNGTILKTNTGAATTLTGSNAAGSDQLIAGNSGDTLSRLRWQ